jgi:hypothetical protein
MNEQFMARVRAVDAAMLTPSARILMARADAHGRTQTVAIDWAFARVSVAGEDPAKLLVSSLSYVERPAPEAPALTESIFAGEM